MGQVMGEIVKAIGCIEQGLGGDAADVEARAAKEFALDAGDFQAELGGANGGGVSARSGADDYKIEIALGHDRWHLIALR